jgi:hypothetical protein
LIGRVRHASFAEGVNKQQKVSVRTKDFHGFRDWHAIIDLQQSGYMI